MPSLYLNDFYVSVKLPCHNLYFSIKQLSVSNINDEKVTIVNILSTLMFVKSGIHSINDLV